MKFIIGLLLLLCSQSIFSQQSFTVKITSQDSQKPIPGVTVSVPKLKKNFVADSSGVAVFKELPSGTYQFQFSSIGYKDTTVTFTFPCTTDVVAVTMKPAIQVEEEVIVTSTRTNSRIADLPMRVEVIGQEELQEEIGIKPGNISSLLSDLSIIHLQNVSAVNGNTAIRMQGLSGRYTQLLRDGLPVYDGLSASFGALSIPPLDLKQVEIIKGSASTLYGGGAIAGLINFISKTPKYTPELTVLLNRSTLKENNMNVFYSQRWNKMGFSVFAGSTIQNAADVNKDGFSDVPQIRQVNLHPKLYFYLNENKTLSVGYTGTIESRKGGDMLVLSKGNSGVHQFLETNKSNRNSVDLQYQQHSAGGGNLLFKSVVSSFNLNTLEPGFSLKGRQLNTYSEASYNKKKGRQNFVGGFNYQSEGFNKAKGDTSGFNSYNFTTLGAFLQNEWHISPQLMLEAGLRTDYHNQFGWFGLPRLALLYKPISPLSIRVSAGTGYKIPTQFTTTSEQIRMQDLSPIVNGLKEEQSKGLNFDINFHKRINDVDITVNQALYYTNIKNPVAPIYQADNKYHLQNLPYNTVSRGTDTYVRLKIDELELYTGYNHTIARYSNDKRNYALFAPQDKFSAIAAYDIEGKWRMGVDASWVGNQYIAYNQKAPDYWFLAAMVQRSISKHINIVLNCENLFDVRQGKREALYTGSIANPQFASLWGPIDGRVFNLSLKWSR